MPSNPRIVRILASVITGLIALTFFAPHAWTRDFDQAEWAGCKKGEFSQLGPDPNEAIVWRDSPEDAEVKAFLNEHCENPQLAWRLLKQQVLTTTFFYTVGLGLPTIADVMHNLVVSCAIEGLRIQEDELDLLKREKERLGRLREELECIEHRAESALATFEAEIDTDQVCMEDRRLYLGSVESILHETDQPRLTDSPSDGAADGIDEQKWKPLDPNSPTWGGMDPRYFKQRRGVGSR